MKYQGAFLVTLAASAAAFPSMANAKEKLESLLKRNPEPVADPDPQLLPNLIGLLTNAVSGILGGIAQGALNPSNKRPEPGFEFQAPGPNDSRGPCPGLNLLANYGYLPRDGNVTLGQAIEASSRGFNMGIELSTVLSVIAVLTGGDIATESFFLGSGPGGVGGLNRHSTIETDISVLREDFYNGCGDNHHLSSRLFKQAVNIVAQSGTKQFDLTNMGTHYQKTSLFSQTYNPNLYYLPLPFIVSLGAYVFYPNLLGNGTYGLGGVANYESISSIVGAKFDSATGEFQYVPEKWPENWYRRATPYNIVQTLLEGITSIYLRNPVIPGTTNLNATALLCDVYQGINNFVPLFVAGTTQQVAAATAWAISKLDPVFTNTILGCPPGALSPNGPSLVFPNANTPGGPLNPPPSVAKSVGNNVYYKTYFPTAPTQPVC